MGLEQTWFEVGFVSDSGFSMGGIGGYIAQALTLRHRDLVRRLVLAGTKPGRISRDEVTIYKSTGHAVEDAAAARLVYDRAKAEGAGVSLEL